jgi:predicted nucleic acid-binding protein
MNGSAFLDTNILIYAIEVGGPDPGKSDVARKLTLQSGIVLSTQVLGEFYRATTSSRRASPLTHEQASTWVAFWMQSDVRPVTPNEVRIALQIVERFKISYYDALILASARSARCNAVLSEDLNSGQDYDGVTVRNPFLP